MKSLETIAAKLREEAAETERDPKHRASPETLRWLARVADEASHMIAEGLTQ